jgi:hypothetical protein
MASTPPRDDFFTVIHKALRAGLFAAALEAGRMDWRDPVQVEDYRRDWERLVFLVRSHAKHEDDHIWPLLESKRPGAVAELGVAHDVVEADIGYVDAELTAIAQNHSPAGGLTFYRALNRFIADSLEHFAAEEPAVMEMMWAMCTDEELAACRSAFMADISPEERAATFELILESNNADDLLAVLQGIRAGMPPEVFESWITELELTMPAPAYKRLSDLVAEPASPA